MHEADIDGNGTIDEEEFTRYKKSKKVKRIKRGNGTNDEEEFTRYKKNSNMNRGKGTIDEVEFTLYI